jgi:glycosyltransferase involved in cell wall biosynthesis
MTASPEEALQIQPAGEPALPAHPHLRRVPRVVVCVATYRRPIMLRTLLESLRSVDTPPDVFRLRAIVVVDNDSQQTAAPIVDAFRADYPCDLIYAVAPIRSIAHARNLSVRKALDAGADFVAFTDDDCVASESWLAELVRVAGAHHGDVVWGRLHYVYEAGTPDWFVNGDFFSNPARDTGTVVSTAETGNVIVRASLLRAMREPFDPDFGLSGGSDSLLFMRLRHAGARIVWANDAVITEKVPLSRANIRWLLQRSFRIGNSGVFGHRAALPASRWVMQRTLKAFGHIAIGAVTMIPGIVRGRAVAVQGLRRIALGAGILAGLFGHKYFEYGQVHGE